VVLGRKLVVGNILDKDNGFHVKYIKFDSLKNSSAMLSIYLLEIETLKLENI